MILLLLSSGLFLGWSLGATDAANVFGSAVVSRMVSFKKAVIVLSVFVILGAVLQGEGPSKTLSELGTVNAIAGSFTVALAAAVTVFIMTKYRLPSSTSQAIVGAIIGWNFYSGNPTNMAALSKIVATWALSPLLSAGIAILLYIIIKFLINKSKIHLLKLDKRLRLGLILAGAFGSFSLGANNIANVMGVFIPSIAPDKVLELGLFSLSGTQQLFLIGAVAIAVGAITYSRKIMKTIGNNIMELSSEAALVVVLSHSIVLFVFSSQALHDFLISIGMPSFPLVPVSSTQAIVGAILGVGLLKKAQEIKFGILRGFAVGWITTPLIAGLISFFALFIFDNVFNQQVALSPGYTPERESVIRSEIDAGSADYSKVLNTNNDLHGEASREDENISAIKWDKENNLSSNMSRSVRGGLRDDLESANIAIQLLYIIGGFLALTVIWILFYSYKRKLKEEKEIHDKNIEIKESQKAYIEAELENTKLLNESLESELIFQKRELTNLALNLIQKNEMLEKIQSNVKKINKLDDVSDKQNAISLMLKDINQSLNIDRERKSFYLHIEEVNSDFFLKLEQNFASLTRKEKQLAALLRLNLSTKEIALLQNISPKSVEMNRYRLRQKMNLEPGESLSELINKI